MLKRTDRSRGDGGRSRFGPGVRKACPEVEDVAPDGEVWSLNDRLHSPDGGPGHDPVPVIVRSWEMDDNLVTVTWCPRCGASHLAGADEVPAEHWARVQAVLGADTAGGG